MLSTSSTSKHLLPKISPSLCTRCTRNLYRSLYLALLLEQPRRTFNPAGRKPVRNACRLSDICSSFRIFVASLPSFRKHSPTILSSVRFWHAGYRLSIVYDRAIDHWIYPESRNARTFPSFLLLPLASPSPSSDFRGKLCVIIA